IDDVDSVTCRVLFRHAIGRGKHEVTHSQPLPLLPILNDILAGDRFMPGVEIHQRRVDRGENLSPWRGFAHPMKLRFYFSKNLRVSPKGRAWVIQLLNIAQIAYDDTDGETPSQYSHSPSNSKSGLHFYYLTAASREQNDGAKSPKNVKDQERGER